MELLSPAETPRAMEWTAYQPELAQCLLASCLATLSTTALLFQKMLALSYHTPPKCQLRSCTKSDMSVIHEPERTQPVPHMRFRH